MSPGAHWMCCCGPPPPAGLLRAIPCADCCPIYGEGIPVDPEAVPDWQSLPVFHLHSRCWKITGAWTGEPPPVWAIIRKVWQNRRYADCTGCRGSINCPILIPGCDVAGPVPDEYILRVKSVGEILAGAYAGSSWSVHVSTLVRPGFDHICVVGCRTSPAVNIGRSFPLVHESFHTGSGPQRLTHTSTGTFTVLYNGNQIDKFKGWGKPYNNNDVGPTLQLRHKSLLGNRYGAMAWQYVGGDGQQRGFHFDFAWGYRSRNGHFWLRGQEDGVDADVRNVGPGGGSVEWSLRPRSYCCEDAPPPDPPPFDIPPGRFVAPGGATQVPPPGSGGRPASGGTDLDDEIGRALNGGCSGCG